MQQGQSETQTRKEVVFGDDGQTIEETIVEDTSGAEAPAEAGAAGEEGAEAAPAAAEPTTGKWRIGDRMFASQEEALQYAQQQEEISAAYRQGVREGLNQPAAAAPGVTPAPAKPAINVEEFYTNPQEFLEKYATQIKSGLHSELSQKEAERTASENIWREFTDRHPDMADFRNEVEAFVAQNQPDVLALINTKGRPAGYDYVATKLKSRFAAYASALKPKRELPNAGAGVSPTARASGVTPKEPAKKALSFAEQVRSIRKRR
jgi:hypothetical protein